LQFFKLQGMPDHSLKITFIGAGAIGTALGSILSETERNPVVLHSIEEDVVASINNKSINSKYFPTIRLHPSLKATTDTSVFRSSDLIFLAIPSGVIMDYMDSVKDSIRPDTILINLAKGFGCEHKTIVRCLNEHFPNPVCTLKGPSFAREILNRVPTGMTLGTVNPETAKIVSGIFQGTPLDIDHSTDPEGVEMLSILKNIYAIVIGIVDAHFNSPNIRFMILTKAFREMHNILLQFGGKDETIFKYCGFGDFTLTALNDLSRNRTLGLLIGKGFFSEHISHELVLEGKIAVNVFYDEISKFRDVKKEFPIIAELYTIFNDHYDISGFVKNVLTF
jgi:glycerol-3-phosphate dehydrogenase (NAD(P)+)